MTSRSPLSEDQLWEAWCQMTHAEPGLSGHAASDVLGVSHDTLVRAIRSASRRRDRTDPWLVARCLRIRADQLTEQQPVPDTALAARLRARAATIESTAPAPTA